MMEAISSIGSPDGDRKKKIITRRSNTLDNLLNNWSDKVKKAEEEWEQEGLTNGVDQKKVSSKCFLFKSFKGSGHCSSYSK